MIDTMYANAYQEVLVIIQHLTENDYQKIPLEYIDYFKNHCNPNHSFEYDSSKTLTEQNMLKATEHILFGLFEKFGATDQQRKLIDEIKKLSWYKKEQEKSERYQSKDIFKNIYHKVKEDDLIIDNSEEKKENNVQAEIKQLELSSLENEKNTALIEVKKDFIFQKIINFLKKFFRGK